MERRSDYKTALLVEAELLGAAADGQAAAARRLAALGVPFEVAVRVLTRPAERRRSQAAVDAFGRPLERKPQQSGR